MQRQDGFLVQFIKLAGPFWSSENKLEIRMDTVLLIVLTVFQMGMAVVITEWNAALFDDLEQRSMSGLMTGSSSVSSDPAGAGRQRSSGLSPGLKIRLQEKS
jgi:ABC-type uncharacterized transport system fused permease/ATPase subunit